MIYVCIPGTPPSYLGPVETQYRSLMFIEMLPLALTGGGDFVDANLLVPTGDGEKVALAGEGEVGDGVLRWIGDGDVLAQIAQGIAST